MKKILTMFTVIMCFSLCSAMSSTAKAGKEGKDAKGQDTVGEYVPEVIIKGKWGKGQKEFGFIDGKGKEPSRGPTAVSVDGNDNIYILDTVNKRLLKFTRNGKYLETIDLEQKRIKIKSKNPLRLYAEKNPKAFQSIYNKSIDDIPKYTYKEIDAVRFGSGGEEIKIANTGKIYFLPATSSFPESYKLVVYSKKGEIIRGFTEKELIGSDVLHIYNLNIHADSAYLMALDSAGKNGYGLEITNSLKINKLEWNKLDRKTKDIKFKHTKKLKRQINSSSTIPPKLKSMLKKCREFYSIQTAIDSESNIFELVWDEKNLDEGAKIIKWKKLK